jgi:hypothetical protein
VLRHRAGCSTTGTVESENCVPSLPICQGTTWPVREHRPEAAGMRRAPELRSRTAVGDGERPYVKPTAATLASG